jgi:hypothetical protein
MGENPSPLGEAFKVDDPLAPPAEAGGLRKDEAKIRNQSLSAVVKAERVAMVVMCWRRAAA